MIKNIFSIDVEEIFQCEYTRNYRYNKRYYYYRTPYNIPLILKFLKKQNVTATFFMVGEIAEKFPEIIDIIKDDGHEIAFHGWNHLPLWELQPALFRQEVSKFKKLYSNCIGYRAPSFSLNNNTKWALNILKSEGFMYDSSIFPAWTPLYGIYSAPIKPYKPSPYDISKESNNSSNNTILEFPLSVFNILKLKIPIAGGFWLRIWNINLIKKGIKNLNKKGIPAVIFVHTWEFDSKTPRLNLPIIKDFITYYNLATVKKKVISLFKEFKFISFADYLHEENKI